MHPSAAAAPGPGPGPDRDHDHDQDPGVDRDVEARIRALLDRMTPAEKVGQLNQLSGADGMIPDALARQVREGRVGSILNEVDPRTLNELQRLAVDESRLGIPLLAGRDVIHGFRTILPIPLGLAATWDPELVRAGARMAAVEAAACGIRWTFAPMVDIGRDPRWGRVAECLGEDPFLSGVLAAAMVRGFQGDDLADPTSLAACVKHFAGYGASEAGRDYNTTNIPEGELRSVHLPPFRAALEAGAATVMTSFSDLNGIPATANRFLLTQVLREEWGFDGFVVSDWDSIPQLTVHGLTEDARAAALAAAEAGVDMDMVGHAYAGHLEALVASGAFPEARLDAMVANVLRVKLRLGLFEAPCTATATAPEPAAPPAAHLALARESALRSVVLLRNEGGLLPLEAAALGRVAVIGPLADEPREQLGTWVFDGDPSLSVTPLAALREALPGARVRHVRALDTSRSEDRSGFAEAVEAAADADVVLVFLGEEAVLSGEAHCRADITLPGAQEALVDAVRATGTPVVLVILAGRPLALASVVDKVDALLYAWHPGTMAGPALADLLLGKAAPSGRLPVTFPRVTGQIPIYHAHRNTGRPPTPETFVHLRDLPRGASQLSTGATSYHLDTHYTPLFPFGFGLGYTTFAYDALRVEPVTMPPDGVVQVAVEVENTGSRRGTELVQLYVRDPVASVTRPVRELKSFRHVELAPGERRTVTFELRGADLAFPGRDMTWVTEPGRMQVWVGGDAHATLGAEFRIMEPQPDS
ncbi:MAG: glycosyl hydrolase [Gemmatimonadales bacterium]|nr:MAG: glycosyl hydrolase [Gemmatimonadales bacterium]